MRRGANVLARAGAVLAISLVIAPLAVWDRAPLRAGTPHRLVEDFSTEQFKDAAATTADWNTAAGEIRLFPFGPAVVASVDPPGPGFSRDLALDGDILCLVDGSQGLRVFDVGDPLNPVLAGSYVSPADGIEAFASDVVIAGDLAFVADGLSGLQIVDISDPANPSRTGHYQTTAFARGVAVAGDFAYVAQADLPPGLNSGLLVIDIGDPASPGLAGSVTLAGSPIGVTVDGDLAYVAGGDGGLYTVAVADPAAPVRVGNLPTPTLSRSIVLAGARAYMATAQSGLYVVDVTNPLAPALEKVYDTPDISFGLALCGDALYVADGGTGLMEFDVTDPVNPVLSHTIDTPDKAIGVAVAGRYAYVSDGSAGLHVIETRQVVRPLPVGQTQPAMSAAGAVVRGDHALVADQSFGLRAVDITDPSAPVALGGATSPLPLSGGLSTTGNLVYASTGGGQHVETFAIDNPAGPQHLFDFDTGGETGRMGIRGDRGYLANGIRGFTVLDLGNPPVPAIAGTTSMPGFAAAADVAGDLALVAVVSTGLRVVDISNPAAPLTIGGVTDGTGGNDLEVHGDEAYVAAGDGLRIYDIRNPASPASLSHLPAVAGVGRSVAVSGNYAVLVTGSNPPGAVVVIDVSDPAAPAEVGSYPTTNSLDVVLSGDLAYVSDWTSGLRVFQVFERDYDQADNVSQSTNIHASADDVIRVRLTSTQSDSVRWQVTADGGTNWVDVFPAGEWGKPVQPGSDVRWRSTHVYETAFVNPSAGGLELQWLYRFAAIDSVVDVPADAGGWVDVHFSRSGYDFADTLLVAEYDVRRRVPGTPNNWEIVATVPAQQQDSYVATVPTFPDTADTVYSVYSIRARALDPLIFFDSPPDSGFSADNTVAVLIARFDAAYAGYGVRLRWRIARSDGLRGFHVYRSRQRDSGYRRINRSLLPGAGTNEYTDTGVSRGVHYWYRLGAVDRDGEFLSLPVAVAVPAGVFRLFQNHPNPFNPVTTIAYEVAARSRVTLQVFDVNGALVRTLVDAGQTPGANTVVWDGRDRRGRRVASGVYFYRLRAGGMSLTRKMALLE
ncbi:MAG: FlgD immunoglobulin-like domain containing protein [Candidatus Krumholzibacteriia bacterium]